jgi:hypothetical protein
VTPEEREVRHLRQHLRDLSKTVVEFLIVLDETMKSQSTVERGRHIAALTNALELANDQARHFGLRMEFPAMNRQRSEIERSRAAAAQRRGER